MCTKPLVQIVSYGTMENGKLKKWFETLKPLEAREIWKPPYYKVQELPCGQCIDCRLKYSREWAFRCMCEAEQYEHNEMLTLTYNEENIPKNYQINPKTGCVEPGGGTLVKKDVQDFLKRLRKKYPGFRYYMCGEYGDKHQRPHYHLIMFNLKVDDKEYLRDSVSEWSKIKNKLYTSKDIEKIWGKGFITLNEVNFETCAYVARYVTKKVKGPTSEEEYELRGQLPEYTCMSRNPGIGEKYYQLNKEKFYEKKKIWQKTQKGLLEINPGRYFEKLIEKENEEILKKLKKRNNKKSKEFWEELLQQTELNKDEYIEQKDKIVYDRYRQMKRSM